MSAYVSADALVHGVLRATTTKKEEKLLVHELTEPTALFFTSLQD